MMTQSVSSKILVATATKTGSVLEKVWLVQITVSHVFGVSLGDLCAPTRRPPHAALARQVAMYLCHVVFSIAPSEVARSFRRDPSTVAHALRHIEDLRDDPEMDRTLAAIEAMLVASWRQA